MCFASNPNVTAVFGTAGSPGDVNGWKYSSKDLSRADRLKVTGNSDVALCWVDGDLNEEGIAGERALFVLESGKAPALLTIGSKLDVQYSSPRYKNAPAAKVDAPMPNDVLVPDVVWGPAEQAAANAAKNLVPPVTIPDENNPGVVPNPLPAGGRRLSDIEAETKTKNAAARQKFLTPVTAPAAAVPVSTIATTPVTTTVPTPTIATPTTGTSIAPTPTVPRVTVVSESPSKAKSVTSPPVGAFAKTVSLSSVNGRFAAAGFDTELSLAGSADDVALVQVGPPGRRIGFGAPEAGGIGNGNAKQKAVKAAGALNSAKSNQVRYVGGLGTGVDLNYEVYGDFVKESVVLASKPVLARAVTQGITPVKVTYVHIR